MAVTEREISNTSEWLQNTKHITVDVEWLEPCLSWLKSRGNEYVDLKNDVYEQWLISDLSDSGFPVLPNQISTISKTFTQGIIILQMNSIVDIGASAYSQLKKLKNEINDDASVDEERTQAWQPKPCRMLKLELTDGRQTIGGMEYQPMRKLSTNLKPGTKILIKENTLCRSGMLFLTDDNVEILGGNVPHMVEENSQMNILQHLVRKANGDDDVGQQTDDNANHVLQNNDHSSQIDETNSQRLRDLESLLNDDDDFLAELDDDTINGGNSNGPINQPRASRQPAIIVIDDNSSQTGDTNPERDLESLLNDDDDFLAELDDDIINGGNSNVPINRPRASRQPATIDNDDVVANDQDMMDDELIRYIEENTEDF
ncbi:recQ-mediated genome instability protein 1-like [Dendronephthya gigantea]|uniref:recQ-mediated genome instability protein 1-like n=1 Tax=Dendronephthya gigantea TaxID=151771 RepID=UPI00106A5F21|nr:recQ-mediated genome instability protein 1-like [Dendronephthya gigantea]